MRGFANVRWLVGTLVVAAGLLLAAGAGVAQDTAEEPAEVGAVVCVDGTPITELLGTPDDGLLASPEATPIGDLTGTPAAVLDASPGASPAVECATPGADFVTPGASPAS